MADQSDDQSDRQLDIERMDNEGAAAAATDPAPALADEIVELRKERDGLQDRLLRQAAEFDNYRKRIDRERRTPQYAAVEFAAGAAADRRRLRARAADRRARRRVVPAGARDHPSRRSLEMLRKRGVTPIDTVGTEFDPQVHQAVSYEDAPERRDGEVIEEFRRGYRLGDRLLRPAMVKVAKA